MTEDTNAYDEAARQAVELGNQIADTDPQADIWDVADGLLAGAVQYWLYARQPCDDPRCETCAPLRQAEWRLKELQGLVEQFAQSSEYYHSPTDINAGRA